VRLGAWRREVRDRDLAVADPFGRECERIEGRDKLAAAAVPRQAGAAARSKKHGEEGESENVSH
jgi:hypothetical protein